MKAKASGLLVVAAVKCAAVNQLFLLNATSAPTLCIHKHTLPTPPTCTLQVFGEITSQAEVDYESVARQVCSDIGYTSDVS